MASLSVGGFGCKHDAAEGGHDDASESGVRLRPSDGDLPALLKTEAAKAQARHLKPFVELRADWCGPCKALEASRNDPRMAEAFAGTYVIAVDADDWAGKLGSAGLQADAIPVFFALDGQGKPTGRTIRGGAWGDDTPANMAPPLKAFFGGS